MAARPPLLLLCALLAAALAGCGVGGSPAARGPTPPSSGPVLVAALGDSITAGSPGWDPDPGVRERLGSGADPESQYEYWAQVRLGGAATFRNCGVFGQRTDEIAARLPACAHGARTLIVQGGINDIAQRRRVATAARNLRGMVARGRELRLRVLLAEVLPWNNGPPLSSGRIRRLNRMIGEIGREEGVEVLRSYSRLEDPRRPGRMKPEWTSDGDHPSVEGYRRLGELVADALRTR